MLEQQQKRIVVHAKSVKDVEDLLYFMCTDELKEDSDAMNMIHLAQFYQMDGLILKCADRMIKDVTVKNIVVTINVFDRYEISEGYQALVHFAKTNIEELKKENNFLLLSHSFRIFRCGILGTESKRSK